MNPFDLTDALRRALQGSGIACPCEDCGHAPRTGISSILVVDFPERPRYCPGCGLGFGASGRAHGALGRDGRVHVPVIEVIYEVGEEYAPT